MKNILEFFNWLEVLILDFFISFLSNRKYSGVIKYFSKIVENFKLIVMFLVLFTLASILLYFGIRPIKYNDLFLNLGTEIVGIIITVGFVDQIIKSRENIQIKKLLLLKLSSPNNSDALTALTELEVRKWAISLDFINLENANLSNANLKDKTLRHITATNAIFHKTFFNNADLSDAILKNADLREAIFQNTKLTNAELAGANLENAKFSSMKNILSSAKTLYGATMPDGNKYNGEYNLSGDRALHLANGGEDTPESWAEFYNVPIEKYMLGQKKA